jgi:multiple sugar transport system ATP-binding protein
MSLADRIVVMNAGTILQDAPPDEVYEKPADLFVANFVGSPGMNFIRGTIEDLHFRASSAAIPLPRPVRAGPATLGIRCEHLRIDPMGPLRGRVLIDEFLGSHRTVHIDCSFGNLIIREDASGRRSVGSDVRVWFDPEYLNVFDHSGKRV